MGIARFGRRAGSSFPWVLAFSVRPFLVSPMVSAYSKHCMSTADRCRVLGQPYRMAGLRRYRPAVPDNCFQEVVMAVIAMTREMGTQGKDVSARLAERLGLTVVHHELVEHDIAERAGAPESEVHHLLEGEASLRERW